MQIEEIIKGLGNQWLMWWRGGNFGNRGYNFRVKKNNKRLCKEKESEYHDDISCQI